MTEEESGSVFGGICEAAGAAWDAAGNAADAVVQLNSAGIESALEAGDAIVAGAAYAGGQYDTAAEWDAAATGHQEAAGDNWDQAGQDLSNAYTDVVGE